MISEHLLSFFAYRFKFTSDLNSQKQRIKILTLIYTNIALVVSLFLFENALNLYYRVTENFPISKITTTFACISSLFLRYGRDKMAAYVTIAYVHTIYFTVSYYLNMPLLIISVSLCLPSYCLILGLSWKYILTSSAIYIPALLFHINEIRQIFHETLNSEQSQQIFTNCIASFMNFVFMSFVCIAQRVTEENLWYPALQNFSKSEDITKEIVQVVESKEFFIMLTINEVKSLLYFIMRKVSSQLQGSKDASQKEFLRIIETNFKAMMDFTNNIMDVNRLKNNRIEVMEDITNFIEIIKRVLEVQSVTIKSKKLLPQVFIDKKIPQDLWICSHRLFQIIFNLTSTAIVRAPFQGRIDIRALWVPSEANQEELLSPINHVSQGSNEGDTNSRNRTGANRPLQNVIETDEFSDFERSNNTENLKQLESRSFRRLDQSINGQDGEIRGSCYVINNKDSSFSSTQTAQQHTPAKGYLKLEVTYEGVIADINQVFQAPDLNQNLSSPNLKLWLCKQLCLKMSGDLRVYGYPNQRTAFILFIPVENKHLNPQALNSAIARPPGKVTSLVVDDYSFNRDLHKLLLEKEDVHVVLASDGKEALETYIRCNGEYFDFILLDIQMPVMDGFTAAIKIREWERNNNIKKVDIYFVSGEYFTEEQLINQFRTKGRLEDYVGIKCVRKPVDVEHLKSIVRRSKAANGNRL